MKELDSAFLEAVKENREVFYGETRSLRETFAKEALIYNRPEVKFLTVPKFFSHTDTERFRGIASTAYSIFDKVIKHYLEDEEYRALFGFSPELDEMILADSYYPCSVPVARIDLFYNEDTGDFKFCEFNTDGTSAMKEEHDITQCISSTGVFDSFLQKNDFACYDILDNITGALLEVYGKYKYKIEKPVIAITDYIENATVQEFLAIKQNFERKGYETVVSDIRQLSYKHNCLYYGDKRIDLLYRRAVTADIMKNYTSTQAFCQAALAGHTCIEGHLRTQIVHNKLIFVVLCRPETLTLLSDEEAAFVKEHIPYTALINSYGDIAGVLREKDRWVVKPTDMYGAHNVFVGADLTTEQWERAVSFASANGYLLQEYCEAYKSENAYFDEDGNLIEGRFNNMTGLYIFNGRLKGILSRLSSTARISSDAGSFSASSITVGDREDK